MQHMSGTPFPTLLSFFTPIPESVRMDGVDRFEKKLTAKTAGDHLACCQVYWRRQVWPAEILLWKSNIRCYYQLCFGLFFGSIGFNFLLSIRLRYVHFAGADVLLERRKSGKCKRYLCKLENTDKSIFFSVKPNFKSDIQNIVNRLLHFHVRQMDQRLGFPVTEY